MGVGGREHRGRGQTRDLAISGNAKYEMLRRALQGLGVEQDWWGVEKLVTSGRGAELLRAIDASP